MSPETSELLLFVDNDEPLYRQKMLILGTSRRARSGGR